MTASQHGIAIKAMEMAMMPSDPAKLTAELAKCLIGKVSREKTELDIQGYAQVMREDIGEFPFDIVANALKSWRRTEKFWPSNSDIRNLCQERMRHRLFLQKKLQSAKIEG